MARCAIRMGSSLCRNCEFLRRSRSAYLFAAADDVDLLAFFGAYSYIALRDRGVGWHDASASSSSIDMFTGENDDSVFEVEVWLESVSEAFFAISSLIIASFFFDDEEKARTLWERSFWLNSL